MACTTEMAIACDLTALDASERETRQRLASTVWPAAQEVRELADGYAVRLPGDARMCRDAADLLLLEHRCCPFLRLAIELEPNSGPLWIRLTGAAGVKEFLQQAGIAQLSPRANACC